MPVVIDNDLILTRWQTVEADVPPTVIDDADDGYQIGHHWIDVNLDEEWVCVDNTPGAALWLSTTSGGGGGGGSPTGPAGGDLYGAYPNPSVVQTTPRNKTFTYNPDGTIHTVTDALGAKTFVYSGDVLAQIVGTGRYRTKTFTYTSGQLTAVTVS